MKKNKMLVNKVSIGIISFDWIIDMILEGTGTIEPTGLQLLSDASIGFDKLLTKTRTGKPPMYPDPKAW